jgi:hypothetical protein
MYTQVYLENVKDKHKNLGVNGRVKLLLLWLYRPFLGLGRFFSLLVLYALDGRTPRTGDQPVSRPLPTHRTT